MSKNCKYLKIWKKLNVDNTQSLFTFKTFQTMAVLVLSGCQKRLKIWRENETFVEFQEQKMSAISKWPNIGNDKSFKEKSEKLFLV